MYQYSKGDSVLYVGPRVGWAEGIKDCYGTVLDPDKETPVVSFPGGRLHGAGARLVSAGALEPDLRPYGYAPGDYTSKCANCNEVTYGVDKRSISCKGCALSRYAQAPAPVKVSACYLAWIASSLEQLAELSRATAAEWEAMPESERQVRAAVGRLAGPAAALTEGLLPEEIRRKKAEQRRVAFEEWVAAARAGAQGKEASADA